LRERIPLLHKQSKTSHLGVPKEGDVVIVKDDRLPRSSWKLGKVLKCITSKDSKVREAKIQLPGHTTVTTAVNYLFSLELNEVSTQPRKVLQNGLNNELCLFTFSFSWECRGVQAGLDN